MPKNLHIHLEDGKMAQVTPHAAAQLSITISLTGQWPLTLVLENYFFQILATPGILQ